MRDRIRQLARAIFGEESFVAFRGWWWRRKLRWTDYEPETRMLSRLVPRGGVCIDAGGNFGQYAYYLSRIAAEVHSFEPLAYNRRVFERVVRAPNVHLHPFALGAVRGATRIEVVAENTAEAHVGERGEEVEVVALDEWGVSLHRLDFIKIDVEGSELEVLRGAAGLIDRFRPAILCEIAGHDARYGHAAEETFELLRAKGYAAYVCDGEDLVAVDGRRDAWINYIFTPC
jgi:FkbM family methyltransferase